MGSSHFGEMNSGGGRSGSSRRGKKSGGTGQPKQPQRGLGIAQLEKIRLHNQITGGYMTSPHGSPLPGPLYKEDASLEMTLSSSALSFHSSSSAMYGLHSSFMMGYGSDMERRDVAHGEPQSSGRSTDHGTVAGEPLGHRSTRPIATLPLLRQPLTLGHDWMTHKCSWRRQEYYCDDSMCSSSTTTQNSEEGSETQHELDLELKLSL